MSSPLNLVSLPTELLLLILEHAISPVIGQCEEDQLQCQRTGFALSLVCKTLQTLAEPLLYSRVILRTEQQVKRFEGIVWTTRVDSISKHTKALWILAGVSIVNVDGFLEACGSLDQLVLRGDTAQIFQFLPHRFRPFRVRELTLIDPVGRPHLSFLEQLQRIHIFTSATTCFMTLEILSPIALARIPYICIELTSGNCNFLLARVLGRLLDTEPRQCHVWLKIHGCVVREWAPDDVYSSEWWRQNLPPSMLDEDYLRGRLCVTLVDDVSSEQTSDSSAVEQAFRAIGYNSLHWVGIR